jgi:hypothetical protein
LFISRILKYAAVQPPETRRTIYFDKSPWVSACIDMYPRYADVQYVGYSDASVYVINALDKTFLRMDEPIEIQTDDKYNNSIFRKFFNERGINTYFWKPNELPKNQLVERFIKTLKRLMLKYIDTHEWPFSDHLPNDAQQVLDVCIWYYNRVWHKSINAISFEVFYAYDVNR